EDVRDVDAEVGERVVCRLDVVDHEVEAARRSRRGARDLRAELHRGRGSGRRELDDAEAVVEREVGVEPPTEALVERLRAVGVGDGDDGDLELHVDVRGGGAHRWVSLWVRNVRAAAVAVPNTRWALRSFSSVSRSYFQIGS